MLCELTQLSQGTELRWHCTSQVVLEGIYLLEAGEAAQAVRERTRDFIFIEVKSFKIAVVAYAFRNCTIELVVRQVQSPQCLIFQSNVGWNGSSKRISVEK